MVCILEKIRNISSREMMKNAILPVLSLQPFLWAFIYSSIHSNKYLLRGYVPGNSKELGVNTGETDMIFHHCNWWIGASPTPVWKSGYWYRVASGLGGQALGRTSAQKTSVMLPLSCALSVSWFCPRKASDSGMGCGWGYPIQ